MKVVHGLPAPATDVGDEPVTTLRDPLLPRHLGGDGEHPAQELAMCLGEVGRRRDVVARDDEDMGRGPWGDVAERDDRVVGVDLGRRDGAGGDRAEEAIARRARRPLRGHQSAGFVLMSQPIVPTRPAMAYDT